MVVLEANEPGWGASGRNGGQINPGLKHDPDDIEKDFGADLGGRMIVFSYSAPEKVFELVGRYQIDCDIRRGGGYRASVGRRNAAAVARLADQCLRRNMPIELHDRRQIAEATGTSRYLNALFDPRAGQLQPLKYARGLAYAARSLGVVIACNTSAMEIQRKGPSWIVRTEGGALVTEKVLIATNGYSRPLVRGLDRSVLPVFSSIITSKPLPDELATRILANGRVLTS